MRNTVSIALTFLALLIIHVQARTDPRQCTTSCGDIHNIGYPFRLRGDPSHCGDPDYELYCDANNRTILNFHAGLYYVKRISYADRVIRLVDVNLATGNCGLPYRSLGIEEVLGDGRYNRKYSSPHASFVRCSVEINSMRNNIVPCLSGNTSRVYVNYTDYMLYYLDIPRSCSVFAMALSGGSDDPKVNLPTSYDDIRRKLQLGFDLTWTVECRDCLADGGYCQFLTEERNRFRCSKEEDYATQLRNAILYLAAVFVIGMTILCRYILAPLVVFNFILHKCCSKRNRIEQ
ncbi:hypothetical protein F3Y22_tig00110879pilonHSYRG00075 [Hibiscus syriacus]|uniref:Wall-associated receptor kinase galacturonan-binding domain-containing protein n=1 Tax=Hibiscus syriacus TaxID=106335 RepID=A0A6A2ZKG2_HIBSY|nr:uncharacterized protein LOC120144097 [Hibiscus syriacus]KAE8691799.1 hypothetical protein F3Y22_tig00110879pilonHSYRG00075 [Hibiscus syriacus]